MGVRTAVLAAGTVAAALGLVACTDGPTAPDEPERAADNPTAPDEPDQTADISVNIATAQPAYPSTTTFKFTTTVTNHGPLVGGNVRLVVEINKDFVGGSFEIISGSVTCTEAPISQTVRCNTESLPAGESFVIATPVATHLFGPKSQSASVSSSDPPDPDLSNNTSTVVVNIT